VNAHCPEAKVLPASATDESDLANGPQDRDEMVYESEDLFKERREVSIVHRGTRYCLRITAAGKLILTK
jgi:hemin uptake protein HemP